MIPRIGKGAQPLIGVGVLHAVQKNIQSRRDDIRPGCGAVHNLLGGAHGGADDLGFAPKAIVFIDAHDIGNILPAVLAVGLLPANEGGDELGTVFGRKDRLRGRKDQRYIGADAAALQPARRSKTRTPAKSRLDIPVFAAAAAAACRAAICGRQSCPASWESGFRHSRSPSRSVPAVLNRRTNDIPPLQSN